MTSTETRPRATFSAMTEGTQEDWNAVGAATIEHIVGLPDRSSTTCALLGGDFGGFQVDRLTHSLQTATRAANANRPRRLRRLSRCCTTSATRSARPTTPTSPPRS